MKKSTTYSENPQHRATESLQGNMRPMTNQYCLHTQVQQPMHAGASANARRCISQRTQVRYTPPTTSFARRALLLLTFLVLSLGNVWGEIIWDNGSSSYIQLSGTDFSKFTEGYGPNTVIRIYTSGDGYLYLNYNDGTWTGILNTENVNTRNNEGSQIAPGSGFYKGSYYELPMAKVFKAYSNDNNIFTSKGMLVQPKNDNDGQDDNRPVTKIEILNIDPFLGELTGDKDGEPVSVDFGSQEKKLDFTEALKKVQNPTYVRIYLEKDGKVVDDPLGMLEVPNDMQYSDDNKNRGYYVFKEGGLTAEYLDVTLKLNAAELDNYQVVTVWSKTIETLLPNKEPDWDLQYTFTFEYPFKGDATSAILMETTFKTPPSQQSAAMTLSFDYANGKVVLKNSSNTDIIATAPIDPEFLKIYPDASAQIENNFYIRWFVQKNGVENYFSGSLSDATNGSYKSPAKERYYYYWDTEKDNTSRNLNDILKMNIDGSLLSPLTDYKLVFTIATNTEGIFYDDADELTHEPDEMAYQYTFHFEDTPFEAENLSTVKTVYMAALYDKTTGNISPDLFYNNYATTVKELGLSEWSNNFGNSGYVRWYIADKDGKLVSDLDNWGFTGAAYTKCSYGYYMDKGVGSRDNYYNPVFTLPDGYNKDTDYKDYQIVCVMTTNKDGISLPDNEPTNMQVKFVFSEFLTSDELAKHPFVHYKGYSGRDWVTPEGSSGNMSQSYWDNVTGKITNIEGNIRQGVHTVNYELYVADETIALPLPFEDFYKESGGNDVLEPSAYFRWYDYMTDSKSAMLEKSNNGSRLFEIDDRGWFYLSNIKAESGDASNKNIGMSFKGSSLKVGETAVIACDVSKYHDGIITNPAGNGLMLLHEPTLSVRYVYTIRRAEDCASMINQKASVFEQAINEIKEGKKYSDVKDYMFDLFENNGKTIVSLNGTAGEFSLRASLPNLGYYYIANGEKPGQCDNIDWYAYCENEKGLYYKPMAVSEGSEGARIYNAHFSDFIDTYYLLSDETQTADVNTIEGTRIHVIGYLKSGTTKVAAIHYELSFIDAPALPITTLVNAKETSKEYKRTKDYLNETLDYAGEVNFDDLFKNPDGTTNYDKPKTWEENILQMPLEWDEAEYSFCYPGIDAYRKSNGYTGFAPQHGDYILLKSMNLSGVSDHLEENRRWYYGKSPTLLDYTYTYSDGKDYGGFFYVDASDEARTIANLKFNASLCSGSEIYFTMAVADVTEGTKTAPQLVAHVYEMTNDGKKGKLVISFIACTLNSGIIKDTQTATKATWYQYYGYGTIPTSVNLNGVNQNYIVEIDNNSKDTDGADFCVDEIRFYTKTTTLNVKQGVYDCNNEETKTNLYIDVEDLQSHMAVSGNVGENGKTIFWRVCDRNHNPIPENENHTIYQNYDEVKGVWRDYGQVVMPITLPGNIPTEEAFSNSEAVNGFFKEDGVIYFSLAHWVFGLDEGSRYYVALYNLEENTDEPTKSELWGRNDNACDVYSQIFMPRKMYVTVTNGEGKDNSEVTIGCGETSSTVDINVVLHVPDEYSASGFKSYTDFKFDFFLGTLEEYKNIEGLYDAMVSFRNQNHNEYTSYENLPTECKENGEWAVIGETVNAGKLYLLHSEKIGDLDISTDNKTILAIPTQGYVTITDKNGYPRENEDGSEMRVEICDPFEFTFEILQGDGDGPSLTLGFKDVTTYPNALRVVRVGKKQLRDMQNDYILHVPVHSFTTGKTDETGTDDALIIEGALELLSYKNGDNQTNDQDVGSNSRVVATFVDNEINRTDRQYIALNFHGTYKDDNGTTQDVDKYDFKEGFTYRMFFVIKAKNADEGSCDGKSEFLLKVVPEFVTWNGGSSQWNNDGNWNRSTRAELHKGSAENGPTDDNHKTDGHPDGYKDNADLGINGDKAFVPMKFTYVTIPSNNVAPMLKELTINSEGIYDATSMGSDVTKDIRYDLMVRYTEEKCITEGHKEYNTEKIYDCEKFYGNWAKEIYFKPHAELVNQHYLTYEKVWVEKELTAGMWTLMSTPLQNTYAGDMYVPFADGKQATEAFQPIEFNTATYSRTKYPIYQRSWAQTGSQVYTKTNDVRKTDYSANLVGNVNESFALWSHTYNDVWVDYSTWKGFAIRAHKSDYSGAPNALLRLPKADDEYDYYDWNDGNGEQPTPPENALSRDNSGKLFTDVSNVNGVTYGVAYGSSQERTAGDGNVSEVASVVQNADNYVLVGNPYLCSIDMSEFLKENYEENGTGSLAVNDYWTYEDNTVLTPLTDNKIRPLQSFFVKAKAGASEIKFTAAMMTDGNNSGSNNGSRTFALTAANTRGQSSATVTVGEEAKSVEMLFDSNLADVPMVYTVADGQAVSINQVTGLDKPIAFGVTCSANSEPVDVTFSDVAQLTSGEVYVVDAVTGEQTSIAEGSTVSVQPNDYGRYFLLAGATGIGSQVALQQGIMVSVRGRVVTVTSDEMLTEVRAISPDGATIYQNTAGSTTTSFTFATPGVYIIKAENVAGEQQTAKVVVK